MTVKEAIAESTRKKRESGGGDIDEDTKAWIDEIHEEIMADQEKSTDAE